MAAYRLHCENRSFSKKLAKFGKHWAPRTAVFVIILLLCSSWLDLSFELTEWYLQIPVLMQIPNQHEWELDDFIGSVACSWDPVVLHFASIEAFFSFLAASPKDIQHIEPIQLIERAHRSYIEETRLQILSHAEKQLGSAASSLNSSPRQRWM